ncbi:glycoside hydrolase family 3 N-terminal domain-containing protein [Actinomycetes bacterium NPDC127524]
MLTNPDGIVEFSYTQYAYGYDTVTAYATGNPSVKSVGMAYWGLNERLTISEVPASLSRVIIQDLLRKKLGNKGVVITDDLEMGAVNKYYSFKDMGKDAIQAGAHLLLVCHEYSRQLEVYNGLIDAVKSGEIPVSRIDEAAKHVLIYKYTNIHRIEVDPKHAEKIIKSQNRLNYINALKKKWLKFLKPGINSSGFFKLANSVEYFLNGYFERSNQADLCGSI